MTQRIRLPEADDKKERDEIKFTKTEFELRLPFIIYADFESVLHKQDSCEPSSLKSFTTQHQHRMPCGSWISDGWYFELRQVNIEDDAAESFWSRSKLQQPSVDNIWSIKPDQKPHDHDHLMREYRSPAHNLNYSIDQRKVKTPCIIHNLKGIVSML